MRVTEDTATTTLPPWLSDAEVCDLCAGLTQPAAQVRYLADVLKVPVRRKPNGHALVLRATVAGLDMPSAATRTATPDQRTPVKPNRAGFKLLYGGR